MYSRFVHKGVNFKCERCGKRFGKIIHLREHIKYVHEGIRDHKCDHCNKAYRRPGQLREHMIKNHFEVLNPDKVKNLKKCFVRLHRLKTYDCKTCGKIFYIKDDFNKHLELHNECEFCHRKFSCKSDLQSHIIVFHIHNIKDVHEGGFIKGNKCVICGFVYGSISELNKHILLVHETTR